MEPEPAPVLDVRRRLDADLRRVRPVRHLARRMCRFRLPPPQDLREVGMDPILVWTSWISFLISS